MKKFFSLVLALVMALSLTTVAWGADLTALPADDADSTADDKITLTSDTTITLAAPVTLEDAVVVDGADVEIKASSAVTITTDVVDAFRAINGGKLTLGENVTITSTKGAVLWANGGDIVINGAKITVSETNIYALAVVEGGGSMDVLAGEIAFTGNLTLKPNGQYTSATAIMVKDGELAISGGKVYSPNCTVLKAGHADAVISISGTANVYTEAIDPEFVAVYGPAGQVNVTGGTVGAGAADYALVSTGCEVTVEDGTVEGVYAHESANAKVTVEGGNITGPIGTGSVGTLTVEGGTFSSAVPAEYVATGMVPVIKDGTFTVGTAPAASGTTGNNSYSSSTTSGVTTSVSAAEKYAIYDAASTAPATGWTVKSYTTMATKTVTSNGVTTVSYIPAYYTVTDGTKTVKLYEADANSGTLRIFKGDQFVTYVNPLFNALDARGYVEGDYIADSAAYIAKDKGCGTYGADVYKINNDKAYAVAPNGRFVAVINGKVAVYDGARLSVPHTFTDEVTYKSTTDLTVVAVECDVCEKVFQTVKTTKLPATYKGATVTLTYGGTAYYVLLESAATSGGTVVTPSTDKVESAATFDAGIAMYVGMSIMAATGAVVLKKREG